MKKFFYLIVCALTLVCSAALVSCDREDSGDYFAGESEADFKPAAYQIVSTWNLDNAPACAGMSASEKQKHCDELAQDNVLNFQADSRKDAEALFDKFIKEVQQRALQDMKGMKATFKLKRGSAIMKSATVEFQ